MENATGKTVHTRNGELDFFRFVFAVVVFCYHLGFLPYNFESGYLGVEFFFLCSGYFLMQFIRKDRNDKNIYTRLIEYTKKRLQRLYLPYIFATASAYFIKWIILKEISLRTVVYRGIPEFFMLQGFGFTRIITTIWYVSALMICSVGLYWLSMVLKDHFLPFLFFSSFIIVSILIRKNGSLNSMNVTIIDDGTWRGFAEMGFGCLLYAVKERINTDARWTRFLWIPKILLSVIILYLLYASDGAASSFLVLVLLFVFLLLLFTDDSRLHLFFNKKIFYYLGNISYDFYLNQVLLIYLIRLLPENLLKQYWLITLLLLLISNVILSGCTHALFDRAVFCLQKNNKKSS